MLRNNTQAGFTMVELMISLIVAAIILTQGVPAFSTFIQNNRLVAQTNKLVADINLARSEAIKRGVQVILCRSSNPSAAAPTCGGTANTWSTGWLVFASADGDTTYTDGTDILLRVGLTDDAGITSIMANAVANSNLVYTSSGLTTNTADALFMICDDRGTTYGNQIEINPTGRPRLIKGTTTSPISACS